jgi:hypothetical protein
MWNYNNYIVVLAIPLLVSYNESSNELDMRLSKMPLSILLSFVSSARNLDKHYISLSLLLQIILILMHLSSLTFSRFQKPKEN